MRKVLVSDFDKTFYITEDDILKSKKAVKNFRNKKNIFIFATGRSYSDFKYFIKEYKLKYDYLILNHGSSILYKNKKCILKSSVIDKEIIKNIVNDLYLEKSIKYFCCSIQSDRVNINDDNIIKINVKYSNPKFAQVLCKKLKQKYLKYVNIYLVSDYTIEIVSKHTNKYNAIKYIIEKNNIDTNDVYTIGDNEADVEMIKNYNGFSMYNSSEELSNYKKYKSVRALINDIMDKKNKRIKWKNIIILLFFILFLILFIYSIINIIKWNFDSSKTKEEIETINKKIHINEIEDDENTELIASEETPIDDLYWKYIKMNLIDVDLDELKKSNSNTVGWIQVNGTTINYPFVQYSDNDYYLNHSFNNKVNEAGWVFLDYRNNNKLLDKNNIIYAHGRMDKTMFGSLRKVLTNGWLDDFNNYVIKISTENENTLWQVFSVYKIPTTNDYIKVDFSSDDEYLNFINLILNRSQYDFNTYVGINDRIVTLSTCYNDEEKVVLHAKLIKLVKKS